MEVNIFSAGMNVFFGKVNIFLDLSQSIRNKLRLEKQDFDVRGVVLLVSQGSVT